MQTLPPQVSFAQPTPAAPSLLALASPVAYTPAPPVNINPSDAVRASVSQLLGRAYSLPCSTAANAFTQLVQPNARFSLALDALLPLLDSNSSSDVCQRILVSYLLYSLYAPHPIMINPFKSALFVTYAKERQQVLASGSSGGGGGVVSPQEQLVWVLWKILCGDGDDISPYSPSTLARSPLPDKLRANILVLDERKYLGDPEDVTPEASQPSPKAKPRTLTPSLSLDVEGEAVPKGVQLLLEARERVLTLAEQRIISPLLPDLAASRMLTSLDLAPIIAYNTTLAHPLFIALLLAPPPTPSASEFEAEDDPEFPPTTTSKIPFTTSMHLHVLTSLPPSLPTFDLLGRLLRDNTEIPGLVKDAPGLSGGVNGKANGHRNGAVAAKPMTVSELARCEVLGKFVSSSVEWLERAEREEKEGRVSDDRFLKGVQNFCRFYHSLIKLSIVDPSADAQSAEMKHFSLRHSRFEAANGLYRVLARGGGF